MIVFPWKTGILAVAVLLGCAEAFQPVPNAHFAANTGNSMTSSTRLMMAVSRREALETSAGIALSTLLLTPATTTALGLLVANAAADENTAKTMVITGANSGIGFEAVKRLAVQNKHRIVLACRNLDKAKAAIAQAQTELGELSATLIPAECDLTSKASIAKFAKQDLPKLLLDEKIDVLCLNAGLARNTAATDVARTADGFELTVGTNHFGHFYLQHLVQPQLSSNSNGAQIVVTASGVHDPESPGGAQGVPATLGDLSGLESQGAACEMLDGGAFNADKAYKDSKLCNVLFTRELQKRLLENEKTRGITANCFNPGLIVFDVAATNLLKVGETPSFGGGCLAYMTTARTQGGYYTSPPGSVKYGDAAYGNQFTTTMVSKEAQDDAKARKLWELSEKALGI